MKDALFGLACLALFNALYLKRNVAAMWKGHALNPDIVKANTVRSPQYWVMNTVMFVVGIMIARTV